MPKLTQKAIENKRKYLKPPSIKQINEFKENLDVSDAQFERFFGLGRGYLYRIRNGLRELPMSLWHYIYEGKIPAYGLKSISIETSTNISSKKRHTKAAIKAAANKKKVNTDVFVNRFGQ